MKAIITTLAQLSAILETAKCGGQYVTINGESDVRLNKFPTDGSERIRIKDGFAPRKSFTVKYHFGADYDKAMAKALGVETYEAHDSNREHLVHNVLMRYISTGTACLIYMPESYSKGETLLNGQPMSEEDKAYMCRYLPKASKSLVTYRTLSVKNVKELHIGGNVYEVRIVESEKVAA